MLFAGPFPDCVCADVPALLAAPLAGCCAAPAAFRAGWGVAGFEDFFAGALAAGVCVWEDCPEGGACADTAGAPHTNRVPSTVPIMSVLACRIVRSFPRYCFPG